MKCAIGHCGHCQLGPPFVCKDGPVFRSAGSAASRGAGAVTAARPKLAVWKFASCDGCQLSLLDFEHELLALRRSRSRSPTSSRRPRGSSRAPTTSPWSRARSRPSEDVKRIQEVRAQSRRLVTIGACATAGGIQALRNFADVEEFMSRRLRLTRVHLDARRPRPRSRPRQGRLRAAGLPDRSAPAARGDQRLPQRAPAPGRAPQRLRRLQAAPATSA